MRGEMTHRWARPLAKNKVKVGDAVTVKRTVPAYYNRQAISPSFGLEFCPGMVGRVGRVDVPNVTGREISFVCVDWEHGAAKDWDGVMRPVVHRAAVYYDNIKLLKKGAI